MNSETKNDDEAFVWIWLPGETEPVVVGRLISVADTLIFNYGQSYLERTDAISLYTRELPLQTGELPLPAGLSMPGCIRDGAPDAWGRRVLLNRILGAKGKDTDVIQLHELTYLLESGSDRIGALDFQRSSMEYIARAPVEASLDELIHSAERVEQGVPLTEELDAALYHGTAIGGARPKALIEDEEVKYVAKFSSSTDVYSVVKAEFIAMRLAEHCGLHVAPVELTTSSNKDVLLIKRFDRTKTDAGWQRRSVLSALTLLGLDEMMARYASYEDFAEIIRHNFADAAATLKELFGRLVFNVLCGNTDDHARNHAAFWDGSEFSLTPAYDICPQGRTGSEASQSMLISGDNRLSRISSCLDAAHQFLLSSEEARELVEHQVSVIGENWNEVCVLANLNQTDSKLFWGRQFLNPFAFENLEGDTAIIKSLADNVREKNNQ